MRLVGAAIRSLYIMEVSLGVVIVPDSDIAIFMVDILRVHPISLKVSLVDQF